ncbi:amino acid ABC transporter ATP-binding protein [Mycetocola sp.]|jgi:polar amino acid transport system ATP-binding protein|uniref:amino acid ABC transporter ATP-binding protein n=1 Tax=Mycetocola sp. TaxID=1871042 RepID=UPI002615DF58|nr:amino acid ABC transporter ATP-binding protein [Mycetocola sp.]MCU1561027.1 binding-protein-dependent transporter ATP-binding protein [Mycetocola sp.]
MIPDAVPAVRLRGVYQAYGSRTVLRNIDLDVASHEVVALIGPSGCGKSTLLRTVNLLEDVVAGSIELNGENITAPKTNKNRVRQQVGLVFQQFNLFPHLTVLENITLAPRRVARKSKVDADRRAMELLERFGLADKADEYPDRLSGGQQQRVAIIRSLATEPTVILLDEVTSALDPETVGEVLALIAELKNLGLTLILATHEMAFARTVADRIVFMHEGEIVEQGPPSQVLDAPTVDRTRRFVDQILSHDVAAVTAQEQL